MFVIKKVIQVKSIFSKKCKGLTVDRILNWPFQANASGKQFCLDSGIEHCIRSLFAARIGWKTLLLYDHFQAMRAANSDFTVSNTESEA